MSTDGQVVGTDQFTVFIQNVCGRHLVLVAGLNHDKFAQTGCFVGFNTISYTFDYILELDASGGFGNDYSVEGVPLGYHFALSYHLSVLLIQCTSVGNVLAQQDNSGVYVHKADFGQTAYNRHGCLALIVCNVHSTQLFKLKTCVILGLNHGICRCITGHTTGVERTQSKLGTGLTN